MRVPFRLVSALILAAFVAGCGFQLRGVLTSNLPYKTLYIALPETSDVRIWMQRYIKATDRTRIVDSAKDAEAVFEQLQDTRVKTILAVNAQGRVREYRLQLDYKFRVRAMPLPIEMPAITAARISNSFMKASTSSAYSSIECLPTPSDFPCPGRSSA